jgi:uncharacterized protein
MRHWCAFILLLGCSLAALSQATDSVLMSKAQGGDARAQDQLGTNYRLEKNHLEAMKWYRLAAKQGFAQAAFNIATMYYNGDGVASSLNTAYAWFLVAAAEGDLQAADAVKRTEAEILPKLRTSGRLQAIEMLRRNVEVPPNKLKALDMLRALADGGDLVARVRFALLLVIGNELPTDLNAAENYCRPAAKQGYSPAMACLAYIDEVREPKQFKDAFDWYRKAAEAGNAIGDYGMGQLYADGLGVKADDFKAAVSLKRAAPVLKTAEQALAKIEPLLSPKQLRQLEKEATKNQQAHGLVLNRPGARDAPVIEAEGGEIREFPIVITIGTIAAAASSK